MFQNKPFRQILISGILRSPIQLLMLIAMTLITYYYANGDFMNVLKTDDTGAMVGINWSILVRLAVIAAAVFLGQFIAMGITPSLIRKHEKRAFITSIPLQAPCLLLCCMCSLRSPTAM